MSRPVIAILVAAIGIPTALSQGPPGSGSLQWEYRVLTKDQILELGKKELKAGLDRVGQEGWELVAVEPTQPATFYFKKPHVSLADRLEYLKALTAHLEGDVSAARERADWIERMTRKGYASESNLTAANQQLKAAETALEHVRRQIEILSTERIKTPPREEKSIK